jgi:hypothetical protein
MHNPMNDHTSIALVKQDIALFHRRRLNRFHPDKIAIRYKGAHALATRPET